jgi:hypothetical protein
MEKAYDMEVKTGETRQILLFLLSFFLYYNRLWFIGLFDGRDAMKPEGTAPACTGLPSWRW